MNVGGSDQSQITNFRDEMPAWKYAVPSEPDPTFSTTETGDDLLGNFFSRPLKIEEFEWGTGTTLFEKFNPWSLYFDNPRVANRIANFNNLRCKLCVKIVLNGNAFHYGRAIASYIPLSTRDNLTVDRAFFLQDIVGASQRPHVFLNPTTSQGGTLCLPFFWLYDYLNIPGRQWSQMGEMIIHTMQPLKHANGASDKVTVSVFAWAEDVVISMPTSSEPGGLSPQMGYEDEYGKGPISRPASNVARVAGKLKDVPVIGMYAKATEMAANATSAIATLFGMSRPVTVSEISSYKPTYAGNLANTNVADTCHKLSTDIKQELSIDPRTVGLSNVDEMSIQSIVTRESYLTQFPWAVGTAPETQLFTIGVNPCTWASNPVTTPTEMHMPACAFAAAPFKHWRGSMKYRFQIVCSEYHKGRIKIVYDPYRQVTNEYNTNFTQIIDISESKDFTVEIGWGVSAPFLAVAAPGDSSQAGPNRAVANQPYNNGTFNDFSYDIYNGFVAVYVVNELTVPNSTIDNDISINVFVSASDDMQFRNPTSVIQNYQLFPEPQMGMEPQMGEETMDTEESKPMNQEPIEQIGNNLSVADGTDHVFYGESIVSFRALLKRYYQHSAVVWFGTAGEKLHRLFMNAFPMYSGYAPFAVYTRNSKDYNYAETTLLNYLTPAYGGWRGGIRWKAGLESSTDSRTKTSILEVERAPKATGSWAKTITTLPTTSEVDYLATYNNTILAGHGGAVATSTANNPFVEWEMPYHNYVRFTPAKNSNVTSASYLQEGSENCVIQYHTNTNVSDNHVMRLYNSVGEDFTLFFFLGAPRMFVGVAAP